MKDVFLITKERLLHHIDYDIRKSAIGVLNWYIDNKRMLNIFITIRDITYLYIEQAPLTRDELHPSIAEFITPRTEIIGVVEPESPEDEELQPNIVTMDEYLELK